MDIVIKISEDEYRWIKKSDKTVFADVASKECMLNAIKNGTPLESYLPNERCDTCKYVDCSIDNEPCIDCKVPHKSFYEPRQEMSGGEKDADSN